MTDQQTPDTDTSKIISQDAEAANSDSGDETEGRKPRFVPSRRRLSQILDAIVADPNRLRISVADLVQVMDARAFGALLMIFALPNVLPTPPGTSAILGLPLVYLSAQMMLGRLPWLPPFIANRSMAREDFAQLVTRVTPILARAEKLFKPRFLILGHPLAERAIGALFLVLSLVLVLPIPLGNMLPAFAICMIALGVLERDGLWIATGITIGVLSLVVVSGVIYALFKAAIFVLTNAFA
ncbi:MAG: exopolysaccharide biosynthesis protein [Paracoccaceae bacterium]